MIRVPIKTVSESNAHEHWRVRQKRAKCQRGTVRIVLQSSTVKPALPCTIRLVRIAPRKLDQGNLAGAMKHIQDGCADWIGVDDRHDDVVKYEYAQERGKPKEYAIRIEVPT
jgi:hypothetical protein